MNDFRIKTWLQGKSYTIEHKPGTYLLVLELKSSKSITVGKFGRHGFSKGFYLYIGSAFGPGGVAARVSRHRKLNKAKRWHIDYLRRHCSLREVLYSLHSKKLECEWSAYLSKTPDISNPLPGFGSSDCECHSHLFYAENRLILGRLFASLR